MIPTSGLRFVERRVHVGYNADGTNLYDETRTLRVLQQYWSTIATDPMLTFVPDGEWRDVPLVPVDAAE